MTIDETNNLIITINGTDITPVNISTKSQDDVVDWLNIHTPDAGWATNHAGTYYIDNANNSYANFFIYYEILASDVATPDESGRPFWSAHYYVG